MYVTFEIAALFPSPFSRVNKRGNFKTNIRLDSVESFLYYLSSSARSFISKIRILKYISRQYYESKVVLSME